MCSSSVWWQWRIRFCIMSMQIYFKPIASSWYGSIINDWYLLFSHSMLSSWVLASAKWWRPIGSTTNEYIWLSKPQFYLPTARAAVVIKVPTVNTVSFYMRNKTHRAAIELTIPEGPYIGLVCIGYFWTQDVRRQSRRLYQINADNGVREVAINKAGS